MHHKANDNYTETRITGGIANNISDVLSFPGSIDEVMFFTERRSPADIQLDCGLAWVRWLGSG